MSAFPAGREMIFNQQLLYNIDRKELMHTEHFLRIMEGILSNPLNFLLLFCFITIVTIMGLKKLVGGVELVSLFGRSD